MAETSWDFKWKVGKRTLRVGLIDDAKWITLKNFLLPTQHVSMEDEYHLQSY